LGIKSGQFVARLALVTTRKRETERERERERRGKGNKASRALDKVGQSSYRVYNMIN